MRTELSVTSPTHPALLQSPTSLTPQDPYLLLRDLRYHQVIRDRAAERFGNDLVERLVKAHPAHDVVTVPAKDLPGVYAFSFSALDLGSRIGALARLFLQVPPDWSLRQFINHTRSNADVPPLRRADTQVPSTQLAAATGWAQSKLDIDGRSVLAAGILSDVVRLKGIVRLGEEATAPVRDDLLALSSGSVSVGGLTAATAHTLALEWAAEVVDAVLDYAGFAERVPGTLLELGEDAEPVLDSMRYACGAITDIAGREVVERLLAELEIELATLKRAPGTSRHRKGSEPTDSGLADSTAAVEEPPLLFRQEGDTWSVRFYEEAGRFKDSTGMNDLAALLTFRNRHIPAIELVRRRKPGSIDETGVRHRTEFGDRQWRTGSSSHSVIDRKTLGAYRQRISELDEEMAEAKANHNELLHERLGEERQTIQDQLQEVVRAGGHLKGFGNPVDDRPRQNVFKSLNRAYQALEEKGMHKLVAHLRENTDVGKDCIYKAGTETPDWAS